MTMYECTTRSGNIIRTTSETTAIMLGSAQKYIVGKGIFRTGESNYRIVEPKIETMDLSTKGIPAKSIDEAVDA
jgi:hypothetical protein